MSAAPPIEKDLLRAPDQQDSYQLPLSKPHFLLTQLPQRPTFKSDKQKEAASEARQSPAPEKPRNQSGPRLPHKTTGPLIDVRTLGLTRVDLEKAIGTIGKEGGSLYFSSGTQEIDADLTIPPKAAVKIDHGALLRPATKKGSGTLSNADESCAGTISFSAGSTQVTGSGTEFGKLMSGQFISCEGQRRKIRQVIGHTHLEVWTPFPSAMHGKGFAKSSYIIKGSGTKFDTELEVGDFIYHGQDKHIITSISGPDTLTVAEYPAHTFSGEPFTRSVRVKIEGSLEAGLYQIFAGKGVVKFAPGAVASVHPEWWGAKGNGDNAAASANSNAIEKALHSVMGNQKAVVEFSNGRYFINRPIVILPGNSLIGQGMSNSNIQLAHHTNCHMVEDSLRLANNPGTIRDIFFNNGIQDAGFNAIHFTHNTKRYVIEKCGFVSYTKHPGGYAIYLNVSGSTLVKDNFIYGFHNGIYAYGFDSFYINNEIAPSGDYAIFLIGDGNVVQGNIMYGDAGCKNGIYNLANFTSIVGNRIDQFDYGVRIHKWGGLITGNVIIANRLHGIYSDKGVGEAHITDNKIIRNGGYGLFFKGYCNNSLIKNNTFTGNNGGSGNPQIMVDLQVAHNQGFDEPLVEDNVGVDLQCDYPRLAQSGTPNIRMSRRWKTANAKPTTITDFLGGCRGKEILVTFGDSQTTLKYSGDSRLKGNGGKDWRPAVGDHLRAVKGDNGCWYCECYASSH